MRHPNVAWFMWRSGATFNTTRRAQQAHCRIFQGEDMSTSITLLANGYLEIVCTDPWRPLLNRHYIIRRTVDYASICIQ